jgi:hypothetical protein
VSCCGFKVQHAAAVSCILGLTCFASVTPRSVFHLPTQLGQPHLLDLAGTATLLLRAYYACWDTTSSCERLTGTHAS